MCFIISVRAFPWLTSCLSYTFFFTVAMFLTISLHVHLLLTFSTVCISILSLSNAALILCKTRQEWVMVASCTYSSARAHARTHGHRPCLLGGRRLPTRNLEDSTVKYSHYAENCSILPHLLLRPALGLRSEFQICLSIVSFYFFYEVLISRNISMQTQRSLERDLLRKVEISNIFLVTVAWKIMVARQIVTAALGIVVYSALSLTIPPATQ